METIDAGSAIAEKLKAIGSQIPIYIVSTASDALVGAVGLRELGISACFSNPEIQRLSSGHSRRVSVSADGYGADAGR